MALDLQYRALLIENWKATLQSDITALTTVVPVEAEKAALLTEVNALTDDAFFLTIDDGTNLEVVACTNASLSGPLTVQRGLAGSTGHAFSTGARVEARWPAQLMQLYSGGPRQSHYVNHTSDGTISYVPQEMGYTCFVDLSANVTFFNIFIRSPAPVDEINEVLLVFQQDGTGGRTVNWSGSIFWEGADPVVDPTADTKSIFRLIQMGRAPNAFLWYGEVVALGI